MGLFHHGFFFFCFSFFLTTPDSQGFLNLLSCFGWHTHGCSFYRDGNKVFLSVIRWNPFRCLPKSIKLVSYIYHISNNYLSVLANSFLSAKILFYVKNSRYSAIVCSIFTIRYGCSSQKDILPTLLSIFFDRFKCQWDAM